MLAAAIAARPAAAAPGPMPSAEAPPINAIYCKPPPVSAPPLVQQVVQTAAPTLPAGIAAQLLAAHNAERLRIGVPPLAWDEKLAGAARAWATQLAQSGQFEHSSDTVRGNTGENLWEGTADSYTPEEMIADFISEREQFKAGVFPDVATSGTWHDIGHYTQLIWPRTRAVGCAIVQGGGNDVLVCRYYPAGNVIGQKVP